MLTTITERGQISIPAELRRRFQLKPGMGIEWIERDEGLFLYPVPADPIASFRSQAKGENKALLKERRKDHVRESKRCP